MKIFLTKNPNIQGFFPHKEKSEFVPKEQITYLGFELNSIAMTVKLTKETTTNIEDKCATILDAKQITILALEQVIGHLVSSFPGVEHGPLYYRNLEYDKTTSLVKFHGHYNAPITLSTNLFQI